MASYFDLADMDSIPNEGVDQPEIIDKVWQQDEAMTDAINHFESIKPNKKPHGIKVSTLPTGLNFLLRDNVAAARLVTRKEQRKVIQIAFKTSRNCLDTDSPRANSGKNAKQFIVALRGSPGIGKSWSSLLYLKLLLLEKRRSILFESGSDPALRTTYLFTVDNTVNNGSWTALKLIQERIPTEWVYFSNIDTIVDPAQFPSKADPSPSLLVSSAGHIFIPVSPDNRHLGGTHKTSSATITLILGPWSLREFAIAWPWMFYKQLPPPEEYDAKHKLVEQRYYKFGGLPRYLLDESKAYDRESQMTPANAKVHAQLLLDALVSGQIDDRRKMLTLFFTMYPGTNDNGEYDPDLRYSTVEFVSYGALRAAGQAVFEKINSDVVWRNSTDASSVGLAYEAAVLMFLHMGSEGMQKLGITAHCRELIKDESPRTAELHLGFCPYKQKESSNEVCPVVDVANEAEFFEVVKKSGDTLKFSATSDFVKMSSNSKVSFPPPGLANVDGMSGPRLGFQATLQVIHPPSGASYIKQRRVLDVEGTSAICFVVPYGRFTEGWSTFQNFRWITKGGETNSEDKELPSIKRRRGVTSESINASEDKTHGFTKAEQVQARQSLRQFVVSFTLENKEPSTNISAPRGCEDT